ncbi:tyrosine-protein phosphatase [Jidongwangia harbinensis]|uniref:tyrosine-protein phosphatase n=1 Tax=Jidongwangia harbinensis TaxID=2878561 RepID=UPI001CD9735F|nr:tyrosine-protein phosphatase [Jidongwangia harbinensis]MCA2217256.1 tyrosine-protein phosphatase [Jidongwangia harbinensis]
MAVEPYPRNLTFSSAYNFRDVGGYAGADGRTVRWRRLFRADSLHRLEGEDWAAFSALGVRTVIDLRRTYEVEQHGRVPEADGLDYRNLVLEHVDWQDVPYPADVVHARWLADRYLNFAEDGHVALAAALGVIADPDAAPVVVHCMAGKDRTGVTCALALALVGVSDADVAADYALTETSMRSLMEYLRGRDPASVDGREHMFDSPAEAMLIFLRELRERHGSVESYARDIGLTDAQLSSMRASLLTPA